MSAAHLVVGLGVTGTEVARALLAHREAVVAVDDRPGDRAREVAAELGIELVEAPSEATLRSLVRGAVAVLPAPGLPARHPVFALADAAGVAILSEFDLAARWDHRPIVAITGTDGKTTVTTLVRDMLQGSGQTAAAVGNTEVPLVAAIDDPTIDVFVVEASSFRLAHSRRFAPEVGTWLNFAPDHLDSHDDLVDYEAAKARIWRDQSSMQVAVGNADDAVVMRNLERAPAQHVTFGFGSGADARVVGDTLIGPRSTVLLRIDEMPRRFRHDIANALAAATTALSAGATPEAVCQVLRTFRGLPHRVALVDEIDGVRYYDDSKATTPHAAVAGVTGLGRSVIMICGGRAKGLDLRELTAAADAVRAVVAIGEAAGEIADVFAGLRPVHRAGSMDQAVRTAAGLAFPGDAVVLAPGCASFDWYGSYAERGDDFARAVREIVGTGGTGSGGSATGGSGPGGIGPGGVAPGGREAQAQ